MLKYNTSVNLSIDWAENNWVQDDFAIFLNKNTQIVFREIEKNPHTHAYQQAVNEFWTNFSLQKAGKVWNGKVISVNKLIKIDNQIQLFYTFTEYKDILFKKKMGLDYLQQNFPLDIENHCFTAILPIIENDYIWGVVGNGTVQEENLIDMIGGSLDYKTNFNFTNLKQKTTEEMFEELNLKITESQISIHSINYFQGCLFFLFTTPLDKQSVDKIKPDNSEIKQILISNPKDLIKSPLKLSDDVKFILEYL